MKVTAIRFIRISLALLALPNTITSQYLDTQQPLDQPPIAGLAGVPLPSDIMANSLPPAGNPTNDLPPLVPEPADKDAFSGFVATIGSLFDGHPKWGFLIYRVDYFDDSAWQSFLDILNRHGINQLRRMNKERLLPYRFFTPMEDRARFEGASKDAIRGYFREWITSRSVERDGPGAGDPRISRYCPRYRFCLYVDKEAMDSISLLEVPTPWSGGVFTKVDGTMVVIDAEFDENPPELSEDELRELEEDEPIDGRTTLDVGWMIVEVGEANGIYDDLCFRQWDDPRFYKRPPAVYNGMP